MRTSRRGTRSRPLLWLLLVVAIAIALPVVALGQEDAPKGQSTEQEIDALIEQIRTREAELEEMRRGVEDRRGSFAGAILEKELSEHRAQYRRSLTKLVDLVVRAEKAGLDFTRPRAATEEILLSDSATMWQGMEALSAATMELVEMAQSGSGDEARKARTELDDRFAASSRLLEYMDRNLDQRRRLGLDVDEDAAAYASRLARRAVMTAALLKNTARQIDELQGRPGAGDDVDAYRTLTALRRHRNVLAESQRLQVDLMEEYGLETARLRQGIISGTGKLSQDILNKDVALGLAREWLESVGRRLRTGGIAFLIQAAVFLLILLGFWMAARIVRGVVRRGLDRSKAPISSLAKDFFIKSAGRVVLVLGIFFAIAQLGVEVGPLLASLGIAGLVVGFALQDTLANFASGLMILVYRPFDVGDVVEAGDVKGRVSQLTLVSTMVLTFDNQLLIVPNKQIWGGVIRNVTHQTTRRVDLTFAIGYSDDIPEAERVLTEIVMGHDKVLEDPKPVIRLHELGESSMKFIVRPWSRREDFWDVYWDITREVKRRFDEAGITIPFPQRDVHIYQEASREEA